MSLTKSVLRFGFVCSILFVLDGAKVNHIAHSLKVIGINEIEARKKHFDNFNNHCFGRNIPIGSNFKMLMRNVTECYAENEL